VRDGFSYLLKKYPEVFIIGQGLWSPWYVGNSMTDLDKEFGVERVIDTPVSESACTGAAVGAALAGMKPIMVHPRMDFMLYAMDSIVNEAAKWSSMMGGQAHAGETIRAIINRGGEQGAQHSQALHSWFVHIPGLRVVMPYSVADARDLLIASVLSGDPVIYIDDRWLYSNEEVLQPIVELDLKNQGPKVIKDGTDITLVAAGFSTQLALEAAEKLKNQNISAEVIDPRTLVPLDEDMILSSVKKTGRLVIVDESRDRCSAASHIAAVVADRAFNDLKAPIKRVTVANVAMPYAPNLERLVMPSVDRILEVVTQLVES
jgi:pyruvate dehydrogenase E1 component beta subunit